jgi:quinoprotein glucose dehydrogenase
MRFKLALLLVPSLILGAAQSNPARKTIWSGVYSKAQAARGQATYEMNCSRCHGSDLNSNPQASLTGSDFMQRWREDNVESLFLFVRTSMPPMRRGGPPRVPLSDAEYVDIISYIFQANRFPEGEQELTGPDLASIHIEERDGPKPLPNSSLIVTVGCMAKMGTDNWGLTGATEPVRTRVADVATSDEIKAAQDKPAGTLSFRLQNILYLGPAFKPEALEGHRIQAKGILIRQPNAERIDVRSVAEVAATCGN